MTELLMSLRHLVDLGGPVLWVIALTGVVSWAVIIESLLFSRGRDADGEVFPHLWLLRALAVASPLLGLLGTVNGIIACFADLTAANGRHLAAGIAEALVCTAAGLIVAIPATVFYAVLVRRAQARQQFQRLNPIAEAGTDRGLLR